MNQFGRYVAFGLGLAVVGALVYFFSNVVAYVLVAWVLSLAGQPLMRLFQGHIKLGRFRAGPAMSAVLVLCCFFMAFMALLWVFVPLVVEQAQHLAEVDYVAIAGALEVPLNSFNAWLVEMGLASREMAPAEQVQRLLQGWFEPAKIGTLFSSLLGTAGGVLMGFFSVVFIAFFFLKEQGLFTRFLLSVVPNRYERRVSNAVEGVTHLLGRYFAGIFMQMVVITLFVSVGLGLLGVQNALLIGFFAAVINVVPYLGPLMGLAFGLFITISSNLGLEFYGELLPLLLRVAGVFGAMQLLDNFMLQPYIFSNSVLAHPLEVFIVILMGAQVYGVVGMILAIPAYTVLRVIARVFLSEFEVVQKLTGRIEDMG